MKIKFILVYYTRSKYLGMKKEHFEMFDSFEDLVKRRNQLGIRKDYKIFKQIV